MKRFIIILFLVGCFVCLYGQDSTRYSLSKCIDIALKNNLAYNTTFFQKGRSNLQKQQAAGNLLPNVSAFANQGIGNGKSINPFTNTFIEQQVNTGQYGLNGSLTLFNGLSNVNNLLQNTLSNQADKADLEQATIDLKIQVTQAYFQVLNAKELIYQAQTQSELTQAQLKRLNTLNDNSAVNPSVLYDTKGQLANDKVFISNAILLYKNAVVALSQTLNFDIAHNSIFETPKIIQIPDKIDEQAIPLNAPMLQSAMLRKRSAYKNLQMNRGSVLPTVSLIGSLGSNYSSAATNDRFVDITNEATSAYVLVGGNTSTVFQPRANFVTEKIKFNDQLQNNLNSYVGISVQLPLLNGLRGKTQMQTAKINYKQADLQLANTKNRFSQLIKQTQNELANAQERFIIYEEQVEDFKNSFNIATTKFESGALNTFEYIMAKNNYDRAVVNLINAKYDYSLKAQVLSLYKY